MSVSILVKLIILNMKFNIICSMCLYEMMINRLPNDKKQIPRSVLARMRLKLVVQRHYKALFQVELPLFSGHHRKNLEGLTLISANESKKNRSSLAYTLPILEPSTAKRGILPKTRLHCCHTLLKINQCKCDYLKNHNRQLLNSKRFEFLMEPVIH